MQYTILAVSALAASAFAAPQASSSENLVSVLSVLQTALPSSVIAEALTNSAAVSSEIASEFAAGNTPTWFTALPSDIQTYLVPAATTAANITSANATTILGTATGIAANSSAVSGAQSGILASASAHNSSVISRASLGTSTASSSGSSSSSTGSSSGSSGSSSGSSSSSSAGASMPTAIIGAGLAGALGVVGLFAL
ncbi:hypothetical protein LTR85_003260 [Meristemomyces frigidus]|nr:hypothetical protein LTR85_003260 [Meristemomyces frigidus]